MSLSSTYDHRFKNIALPVRSAVLKLVNGGLVVRWVTTGESLLLYVFVFSCATDSNATFTIQLSVQLFSFRSTGCVIPVFFIPILST